MFLLTYSTGRLGFYRDYTLCLNCNVLFLSSNIVCIFEFRVSTCSCRCLFNFASWTSISYKKTFVSCVVSPRPPPPPPPSQNVSNVYQPQFLPFLKMKLLDCQDFLSPLCVSLCTCVRVKITKSTGIVPSILFANLIISYNLNLNPNNITPI